MSQTQVSDHSGPGYPFHPGYSVDVEVSPRQVRVVFAGEEIVRTTGALLVHETAHVPVYYFPQADVRMDLMTRTDHSTHCPFKGDASYWMIAVGDQVSENAVWSYLDPYVEVPEIKDHVAFYWNKMDAWFEEDEEIFVHARDPYKRIDAVPSRREVKITVAGEIVAQSTNAHFLFETGLPTRYYLPRSDVRTNLLTTADTSTRCPYKGIAAYYDLTLGDQTYDDLVWTYPDPIAECPKNQRFALLFQRTGRRNPRRGRTRAHRAKASR